MKNVDPDRFRRIVSYKAGILRLQLKLSEQLTEFNEHVKEKWVELIGNDKEDYDKLVEHLNDLIQQVNDEQQTFWDAQPADWQNSADGHLYQKWMDAWACVQFDDFDVDTFEELFEPTLLKESDFNDLAPGPDSDIEYAEIPEKPVQMEHNEASMKRQALIADWQRAVIAGDTQLGFKDWQAQQDTSGEASDSSS